MKKIMCFLFAAVFLPIQLFAVSKPSENALNAFRRYEPDFTSSLRRLEEIERRMADNKIDLNSERGRDMAGEAREVMRRSEKRYDLLEDLYSDTVSNNPADKAELFDGFSRLDDLYKDLVENYESNFLYSDESKKDSVNAPADKADDTEKKSDAAVEETGSSVEEKADAAPADALDAAAPKIASSEKRLEVSGKLKLGLQNGVERKKGERNLPNNSREIKLNLNYKLDEQRSIEASERFMRRERNDLGYENTFDLAYLHKVDEQHLWTVRNTLQHMWYSDSRAVEKGRTLTYGTRDYRNNKLELLFNEQITGREHLSGLAWQVRRYPRYSRSDFRQISADHQETWFKSYGTIFAQVRYDDRTYGNNDSLDYNNFNLLAEYDRTFYGNKSELSLSNTYDRRDYGTENKNAYRTDYYNNYFVFNYNLPVHDRLSYYFAGSYDKRDYNADYDRGYAQLDVSAEANFRGRNHSAQFDYEHIFNDENTELYAHKNNILHAMWQRSCANDIDLQLDDTYHMRAGEVGNVLDFNENLFEAKLTWSPRDKTNIEWFSEICDRSYDTNTLFLDYKYSLTGLGFSYKKRSCYDWRISQSWRRLSYKDLITGWEDDTQPITEFVYNLVLRKDLKFKFKASYEESYAKAFNSTSQEMEWDFTRPQLVKEFSGTLEYTF